MCKHGEVTNFTSSAPNGLAPPHTTIKYTPGWRGDDGVCVCHDWARSLQSLGWSGRHGPPVFRVSYTYVEKVFMLQNHGMHIGTYQVYIAIVAY